MIYAFFPGLPALQKSKSHTPVKNISKKYNQLWSIVAMLPEIIHTHGLHGGG